MFEIKDAGALMLTVQQLEQSAIAAMDAHDYRVANMHCHEAMSLLGNWILKGLRANDERPASEAEMWLAYAVERVGKRHVESLIRMMPEEDRTFYESFHIVSGDPGQFIKVAKREIQGAPAGEMRYPQPILEILQKFRSGVLKRRDALQRLVQCKERIQRCKGHIRANMSKVMRATPSRH